MRSRYLWWEAENSELFWMRNRVGKGHKKVVLLKSGGNVWDSPWDLASHLERRETFFYMVTAFLFSLLVNLSLTCILSHVYFPKLNLLLDCNKEYIPSIYFKLFSLSSSRQAFTLMRLVCVCLMWSDQLGQADVEGTFQSSHWFWKWFKSRGRKSTYSQMDVSHTWHFSSFKTRNLAIWLPVLWQVLLTLTAKEKILPYFWEVLVKSFWSCFFF